MEKRHGNERPPRIYPDRRLLIFRFFTSCEQTQVATPTPVTIVIAGATGMRPVLQALTSEFSRLHPSVIFDLRGGGSTIGEQLIANGEVDLAASVLPATENSETQGTPTSQKLFRAHWHRWVGDCRP